MEHPLLPTASVTARAKTLRRRIAATLLTVLATIGVASPAARAAGTSPDLALVAADAFASDNGAHLVTVTGAFHFDDLVQIAFPAAGLFVVQGTRFARFDVEGAVFVGTSSLVANGIQPSDVEALLALGSPAAAPARLVRLGTTEISVVLPSEFDAGPASTVLFAVHDDESFVSNAIVLVLP